MSTTNNLQPKPNRKSSATRAHRADRVTPGLRTGTGLPALAPRIAEPAVYRAPSIDRRPRGHVIGHAIGEPLPVTLDGRPRGHVVGHAIGEPLPVTLDGRPRGHVVGHAIGEPLPVTLDGRPRGHVVGQNTREAQPPSVDGQFLRASQLPR
jgi:hypothetical protein